MTTAQAAKTHSAIAAAVIVAAVLKEAVFFSISGLVGYQYMGAEDSVAWVAVVVSSFLVTSLAYVAACAKRRGVTKVEMYLYAFAGFMLINHFIWWSIDSSSTQPFPTPLVHFLAFAVPGVMAVRIMLAFDAWGAFARATHISAVAMAGGIVASVLLPFASGRGEVIVVTGLSTLGGATAQSASYFSAFVFGLLGFYLFKADPSLRSPLLRGRAVRVLEILLWGCMALATVLNGGRGGLLLLLIYLTQDLYWIAMGAHFTYRSLLRASGLLLVLPGMLAVVYSTLQSSEIFGVGFRRALDVFLFLGGTDAVSFNEASSNRDLVYQIAIDRIVQAPILGYGAFGHWERAIQPHNVFLDLALQFGLPLACVFTLLGVRGLIRHLRSAGPERSFYVVLGAYPLAMVSFSNGYFLQPILALAAAGLTIQWHAQPSVKDVELIDGSAHSDAIPADNDGPSGIARTGTYRAPRRNPLSTSP